MDLRILKVLKKFFRMREAKKIFKNLSKNSENGILARKTHSPNHKDHFNQSLNGIAIDRRSHQELKARLKFIN
jgi:hypothetical protein